MFLFGVQPLVTKCPDCSTQRVTLCFPTAQQEIVFSKLVSQPSLIYQAVYEIRNGMLTSSTQRVALFFPSAHCLQISFAY